MSDQNIKSDLLEDLSTEEQEVLTGGHRWHGGGPWHGGGGHHGGGWHGGWRPHRGRW